MERANQNGAEKRLATFVVFALIASLVMVNVVGQVRKGRRGGGGTVRGTEISWGEGKGTAFDRHGVIGKRDEGAATVDRHGAVVGNEEDYQAAGPRGIARGVAVKGEEGYYASGRNGVIAAERYEDFEDGRLYPLLAPLP